jgi:ketosteroid isomerase-like protein
MRQPAILSSVACHDVRCCERYPGRVTKGPLVQHDEAALVDLQQDLARAWITRDQSMVERIISPEWTSTGPDGRASDRAEVLAQVFETGVHKIHDLKIDDVKARVFGDAAVVTGRTHGVGEFEGASYDVVIRFTDVFVRREGRWQAIASHASVVQAE